MKAQIQSQVFIYILALFISALILLFGYRAIRTIVNMGERTEYANFQKQMTDLVSTTDYGDVKKPKVDVPGGYKEICFADIDQTINLPVTNVQFSRVEEYPIIKSAIASKARKNLFLVPNGENAFYVGKIQIPGPTTRNFLCIPVVGGFAQFRLNGNGDSVTVSVP